MYVDIYIVFYIILLFYNNDNILKKTKAYI